uniref:WAP domain-containing protein n=1 Tax=Salarias fasciatus TaxID=181472 RepID=A0A672FWT2_SALFA
MKSSDGVDIILLFQIIVLIYFPFSAEKPGSCPPLSFYGIASCYRYSQYRCTCDQDCPGKFKCCNFGCGLVCVRPVPVEKPGVCPRRTHVDWKFCSRFTPNNCTCDQECPGKLKCCDFGCGPTCVKPVTAVL